MQNAAEARTGALLKKLQDAAKGTYLNLFDDETVDSFYPSLLEFKDFLLSTEECECCQLQDFLAKVTAVQSLSRSLNFSGDWSIISCVPLLVPTFLDDGNMCTFHSRTEQLAELAYHHRRRLLLLLHD